MPLGAFYSQPIFLDSPYRVVIAPNLHSRILISRMRAVVESRLPLVYDRPFPRIYFTLHFTSARSLIPSQACIHKLSNLVHYRNAIHFQ
jgi:hypothetical protein